MAIVPPSPSAFERIFEGQRAEFKRRPICKGSKIGTKKPIGGTNFASLPLHPEEHSGECFCEYQEGLSCNLI